MKFFILTTLSMIFSLAAATLCSAFTIDGVQLGATSCRQAFNIYAEIYKRACTAPKDQDQETCKVGRNDFSVPEYIQRALEDLNDDDRESKQMSTDDIDSPYNHSGNELRIGAMLQGVPYDALMPYDNLNAMAKYLEFELGEYKGFCRENVIRIVEKDLTGLNWSAVQSKLNSKYKSIENEVSKEVPAFKGKTVITYHKFKIDPANNVLLFKYFNTYSSVGGPDPEVYYYPESEVSFLRSALSKEQKQETDERQHENRRLKAKLNDL